MADELTASITADATKRIVVATDDGFAEIPGPAIAEVLGINQVLDLDPTKARPAVKVAARVNLTLSGEQTIDGVACVAGDRILPTAQTDAKQNRPQICAANAWSPAGDSLVSGAYWSVAAGTDGQGVWIITNEGAITPGTTEISLVQRHLMTAHAGSHVGGTDAIPAATTSVAGLMAAADKAKLNGMEAGATADQTGAEIVAAIDTQLGGSTWQGGGGAGSSDAMPVVATVAQLPTSGLADDALRYVRGYAADDDGGGGIFRWDAASTATAIQGMIVGTGTGRWIRQYSGEVDVRWCGAKNDDSADNAAALTAALSTGRDILITGGGTYRFASAITVTGTRGIRVAEDTTLDWRGAGFGVILDGWYQGRWQGGTCRYVNATASGGETGFFLWRARLGSTVNNTMDGVHFIGTAVAPATRAGRFHMKFIGNEDASSDDGYAVYYNTVANCTGYGCQSVILAVPGDGASATRQPNGNVVFAGQFQYVLEGIVLGLPDSAFGADYCTDAAITAGDATLTSASNPWVSGDVGKTIWVDRAGENGDSLKTTIASYTSAGSIELTAAAEQTVTAAQSIWNVATDGYDRQVYGWLLIGNWFSSSPAEAGFANPVAYKIRGPYNSILAPKIEHNASVGLGLQLFGLKDETLGCVFDGVANCPYPIETPQASEAFHRSIRFDVNGLRIGSSANLHAVKDTGGASYQTLDLNWVGFGSLTQTTARTIKYVRGLQTGQVVELWVGDGHTTFENESGSVPTGSIALRVEGGTHVAEPASIYRIVQSQGLAHVSKVFDYGGMVVNDLADVAITSATHGQVLKYDSVSGAWKNDTVSGGSYTDEQAQDAVGTILTDSSSIDFTYNDGTPSITATVKFGNDSVTACIGNDSRLSDARTPTSHTHGNVTNAGAIGSTANLPVITTTSGVLTTGSFGTGANTFCQGNDSRLSDARTPTSHTHTVDDTVAAVANQYAARNSGDTDDEARTDKVSVLWSAPITANATYPIALWPNVPVTLSEVSARTVSGTCSIQIQKGGSNINGFSSAVAQTTSVTDTASTETLAEDAYLTVIVTSASSLTGLCVTFKGTRTGN